ncbi:MAG TPA: hypothetical protein VFM46_13435, partial [Pseudomonadales bacterium]|nr:hypothetical protein [Pseudomonadales bacterium]
GVFMPGPTLIARGNISLEMILQVSLAPNNGSSIAANTSVENTYTIPGIQVGDFLEINKPTHTTGLTVGNIRASAANTVAIQWCNVTTGTITQAAENYLISVTRYELGVNAPSGISP